MLLPEFRTHAQGFANFTVFFLILRNCYIAKQQRGAHLPALGERMDAERRAKQARLESNGHRLGPKHESHRNVRCGQERVCLDAGRRQEVEADSGSAPDQQGCHLREMVAVRKQVRRRLWR